LIPGFAHGRTDLLLLPSVACPLHDDNTDWKIFYINMYVMSMLLMSITDLHYPDLLTETCWWDSMVVELATSPHESISIFLEDCDPLDESAWYNSEED
jgi:hypothetical protein